MKQKHLSRYSEHLPDEFSIRHKISEETEKKNFHLHEQLEIIYPLSSNLYCRYEDGALQVPAGAFLLLGRMNLHYLYKDGPGMCDRYVLYFSPNYISGLSTDRTDLLHCFSGFDSKPVLLTVPESDLTNTQQLITDMEAAHEGSDYGSDLLVKLRLGELLIRIGRLYAQQKIAPGPSLTAETDGSASAHLTYDICDYIAQHCAEPLTAESIARTFFISRTMLYRIFSETAGMSPGDYILRLRITRAKDLLLNTDLSAEIIGGRVGYPNLSSFSRMFRAQTGCSPQQFRHSMH